MRSKLFFQVADPLRFGIKLSSWCSQNEVFAFFNRNGFNRSSSGLYLEYDIIAATGTMSVIKCNSGEAFDTLRKAKNDHKDWLFGILGYDLKNEIEDLTSVNFDGIGFNDLQFFRPELIFLLNGSTLEVQYISGSFNGTTVETIIKEIENKDLPDLISINHTIRQRISAIDYQKKVKALKSHIFRGDLFEANFCIEYFINQITINPVSVYNRLCNDSPSPFSCLIRFYDKYMISASPERYLKKFSSEIISQPMKGTIGRSSENEIDKSLMSKLRLDPKEISENIMIVDLVRNDLSKTALRNSVKVENLCEIYSFKTVHQMVSTIKSRLSPDFDEIDVIKSTFPMGSMTGAPKVSAMKLIEEYEETKRGAYSGAAGYFTPENDFDFNVVIRSILYNSADKYLSFITGSAITAGSVPGKEFEECQLKALALKKVLEE